MHNESRPIANAALFVTSFLLTFFPVSSLESGALPRALPQCGQPRLTHTRRILSCMKTLLLVIWPAECSYRKFARVPRTRIIKWHFSGREMKNMKVGIAADHGGYEMKQKIYILLSARGHQVVDFGNLRYDRDDDYPDFAIPLARAVAAGVVRRGILLCGSGIGASIAANKIDGVRAAVCHEHVSALQGVEDDDMNILCLGGRTTGIAVAWDCVKSFLAAKFISAERHLRCLAKVGAIRTNPVSTAEILTIPLASGASVYRGNGAAKE